MIINYYIKEQMEDLKGTTTKIKKVETNSISTVTKTKQINRRMEDKIDKMKNINTFHQQIITILFSIKII